MATIAIVALALLVPLAGNSSQRGIVESTDFVSDEARASTSTSAVWPDEPAGNRQSEGFANVTTLLAMDSTELSRYLDSQGFEFMPSARWLNAHGYGEEDVFCALGDMAMDYADLEVFSRVANSWLPREIVALVLGPIGEEVDSVADLPSVDDVSHVYRISCSKGVAADIEGEQRIYGPAYSIRHLLSQQDYSRGTETRSITMCLAFESDSFATHQECIDYVEGLISDVFKLPAPVFSRAGEKPVAGILEAFYDGFCYAGEVECSYSLYVINGFGPYGEIEFTVRYLDDTFANWGASNKEELLMAWEKSRDRYFSVRSLERLP